MRLYCKFLVLLLTFTGVQYSISSHYGQALFYQSRYSTPQQREVILNKIELEVAQQDRAIIMVDYLKRQD